MYATFINLNCWAIRATSSSRMLVMVFTASQFDMITITTVNWEIVIITLQIIHMYMVVHLQWRRIRYGLRVIAVPIFKKSRLSHTKKLKYNN